MRLVVKSFDGRNILLESVCDNVVDIAKCLMDFLSSQLSVYPSAEFIKFSVAIKREVKQDEIAFDFTPVIITFD